MRGSLGLVLATLGLIIGCQTNPHSEAEPVSKDSANNLKPAVHGRSAGNGPNAISGDQRSPSNESTEVDTLENSYEYIMNSQAPVENMLAYLRRLKSIYFRSQARLNAFDLALDAERKAKKKFTLEDIPAYADIVVMWGIRQREEEKIEFVYSRLKAVETDEAASTANKDVAKQVLSAFNQELVSRTEENDLIYDNLRHVLNPTGIPYDYQKGPTKGLVSTKFAQRLLELGNAEELKNDDVAEEIKETKAALDLTSRVDDRTPQGAGIGPSAGAGGNINGSNFPVGTWALTYDDGPDPRYTGMDVANVKANGAKATFFWLAKNIQLYPGVVKQVQAAGFPTENHSWNHPILTSAKDLKRLKTTLSHEIVDSTAIDVKYYGNHPRFFRCPYGAGANNPAVRQMIAQQGMVHVFWNVDSLDWQDHNPASILARVKKQMAAQRRGIILFHDIHPQSVEGSKLVMQAMKGSVHWVTIPEIVDQLNGGK